MTKRLSVFRWLGGKSRMVNKLLPLFPEHKIYCEGFGGSAAMLLNKEPSQVEIYNDLNSGLVNFFRVVRDPRQFKRLQLLASLTPYSREEFDFALDHWRSQKKPVDQAHLWFIIARMSFGGLNRNWGYTVTQSSRGMCGAVSGYLSAIENLPAIHQRLMRVQVDHRDAIEVIETYDTPETFLYLDPPYVPSTRKSGEYEHELSTDDHKNLVETILSAKGKVMLSGYQNPIYKRLENKKWKRVDWQTVCHVSGRTRLNGLKGKGAAASQVRTESVWLNYKV